MKPDMLAEPSDAVLAGRRALASFQFRAGQLLASGLRRLLPPRMLVHVKSAIEPTTRLDYERAVINIRADTAMDFARATPCRKEPGTVRWIEATVRPGDVFFDIGANVGCYAFIAAAQAPGKVISYAFEPSFSTYNQLCRNVLLNGYQDQIFPHMIALGDATGPSVFNYHSLAAGSSLHTAGPSIDYRGNPFSPVYRQRVLAFTIDDLVADWGFDPPTHLKIDVDGIELQVLLGARSALADSQLRTVLIELCDDRGDTEAVQELMRANHFQFDSETSIADNVSNWVFSRPEA